MFKLCTLMHGAIFGPSPSYIRDLLVPVSVMQGRTRLFADAAGLYDVPFTRTQFPNIRQFKRALKTHYFTEAYS